MNLNKNIYGNIEILNKENQIIYTQPMDSLLQNFMCVFYNRLIIGNSPWAHLRVTASTGLGVPINEQHHLNYLIPGEHDTSPFSGISISDTFVEPPVGDMFRFSSPPLGDLTFS